VTRHAGLIAAILTISVLAAFPTLAQTPTQVPTREGNIWNGKDHQPTEGQVQHNEQAAGVAPTPAQKDHDAAVVKDLDRQLGACTSNCP
jgi:hypothetical protein